MPPLLETSPRTKAQKIRATLLEWCLYCSILDSGTERHRRNKIMPIPLNLHFTEQGSGDPLVLLHGFPLSSVIWREQQTRLSDHYRVITPDLRGHGRSPVTDEAYSMDLLAGDVLDLLDALALPQATIMGHSMGGYVALALAARAPHRLRALGLVGSHPFADNEDARQNRHRQVLAVQQQASVAPVVEAMLPRLFAPGKPDDDTLAEQVSTIMSATKPLGVVGALLGMAARPDLTAALRGFPFSVLVITGDKDPILTLARAEETASMLTKGMLVTIENAGHMMMMEQPQATTMAIRQFMEEVAAERRE